jgi:hypothetical protein
MTPSITVPEPIPSFRRYAGTRRFTVDEYHRMIEAAILTTEDKVELLDGYILYKADYPELHATDTVFPEWRALRPFTPAEYHKMLDLGIISREEKLELLDGYLVLKMSQNPPHRAAMTRLMYWLTARLPSGWVFMVNSTVEFSLREPEPDGSIVRGSLSDFDTRQPTAADFGIVIEVSDSTLDMDRTGKGGLYARENLPRYWIVDVVDKQIEVYTDPDQSAKPPVYRTRTDYKPGTDVPIVLDGRTAGTVPVSDLIA